LPLSPQINATPELKQKTCTATDFMRVNLADFEYIPTLLPYLQSLFPMSEIESQKVEKKKKKERR